MTTSLYSLRSTPTPGEFSIMKFDEDYAVESLYALSATTCTCLQGHKPKCKHRRMLPLFLAAGHVDDGWFLDWTTRLWHHPLADADAPAPLADPALMGDAEHAEEIARRLAPALESEGSSLVPSEASGCEPGTIAGEASQSATSSAPPAPAPGEIKRRRF